MAENTPAGPGRKRIAHENKYVVAVSQLGRRASTGEVADAVGASRRTARRRLEELAAAGRITREKIGQVSVWTYGNGDASEDGDEDE